MSGWVARFTGMAEVKHKLKALPHKLQKSITGKAMTKANKIAVKELRTQLSSSAVLDALKTLSKPNRIARGKAKTEKGQLAVAARTSRSELKKSIGVRKVPRSRMRDKNIVFHAVGPRAFFKITNIRSSKRIPRAASRVARMLEQGSALTKPVPYTRRAIKAVKGPYKDAMISAARDLIAKASKA